MNHSIASAPLVIPEAAVVRADAIPRLQHDEVISLARQELDQFLALLESLDAVDWQRPTECTLWTVKDIVAHQASHVKGLTHYRETLSQFNPLNLRDYTRQGLNVLDAANQKQVNLRASWTPAQLIAEMRVHSEASFRGRQQFPELLRVLPLRSPGFDGWLTIGELIDLTYTRDMWMHRLDICRAAGRAFVATPEHDGRLTALVVRDVNKALAKRLGGRSVTFHLTGIGGGVWQLGSSARPEVEITLDSFDFHRLASGRIRAEQVLDEHLVTLEGDRALARLTLQYTVALY
jgi:uncharacterized protein (TIGR03083 family)